MDKKAIQTLGNKIARQAGYSTATEIKIDRRLKPGTGYVAEHVDYGYRKNTTDEYVPHAYRNKFGWKNMYYQPAKTFVVLNPIK